MEGNHRINSRVFCYMLANWFELSSEFKQEYKVKKTLKSPKKQLDAMFLFLKKHKNTTCAGFDEKVIGVLPKKIRNHLFNDDGFYHIINCNIEQQKLIKSYIESEEPEQRQFMIPCYDGSFIVWDNFKYTNFKVLNERVASHIPNSTFDFKMEAIKVDETEIPQTCDDEYSFEELVKGEEQEDHSSKIVITNGETEAGLLFYEQIKDIMKCCHGEMFLKYEGIWIRDPKVIKKTLLNQALHLNYYTFCNGKYINYSSNLNDAKKIVEASLTFVQDTPTFLKDIWKSSVGKICWNNGYYDFDKKEFIQGFDGVESCIKISRDYPERIEEDIKKVYDKLLDPILGNLKETYLKYRASCMVGRPRKKWLVVMGERDSGKSKLIKITSTGFESYHTTVSGDYFVFERSRGSTDVAKKMSWATCMEFSRFTDSSEIRIEVSQKIDGVLIKSISGGDTLQVRTNYTDEREMDVQSSICMSLNDVSSATPTDVYETMVPFNLPNKFVDKHELDPKYSFMKEKDSSIDDFVLDTKMGDAFFHILLDHYTIGNIPMTQDMIEFKSQFLEVDEFDIIKKHFQITTTGDIISNQDIKTFLWRSKLNMTSVKFKQYLIKRGAIDFKGKVDDNGQVNTNIKLNTKEIRGLRNVIMIGEAMNDLIFDGNC